MLDIKSIRENPQKIIEDLNKRGGDYSVINEIVDLDKHKREIIQEVETLKSFRNEASKNIG